MPSINYCVDLSAETRICVNACEGEFSISVQERDNRGAWRIKDRLPTLSRNQLMLLQDRIDMALGNK